MPIYEYECTKCGRTTEAWQKITDDPLNTCGHCKGKLRKIISMSTFHLKGTGWYATDYANKSGGPAKPSQKSAQSKSADPKTSDPGSGSDTDSGSSKKTAAKSD